jgi:SAM-dependent methyltransferase
MDAPSRLPLGDTLDVRPEREFRVGHFASAICCPLAALSGLLALLPPRSAAFWIFGEDAEAASALAFLRERGFERVELHPAMAEGAAPLRPVSSPWVSGDVRVRLWQPTPFLEEVLADPHAPAAPGRALDVACGSGREACYLALAGFDVVGLDILPDALGRARALADQAALAAAGHAGVAAPGGDAGSRGGGAAAPFSPPAWARADLEKSWPFRDAAFDVVLCFRFLWRPLFPRLAAALRPGGTLVYETFTREQARRGKPVRPDFLLEPGELARSFSALGLRVVREREADPEGGPALASLWAVRDAR